MSVVLFFIFLFIVWILLTLNFTLPGIAGGAVISLIVTLLMNRYSLKVSKRIFQIRRYLWAFLYLWVFLFECIKANMDVAYRVIHPALPIRPGIIKAKTNLSTDIGKTFLANSITMTPGTITVDIVEDYFYIHWIFVKSKDPVVYTHDILGRFEKYIKRIFE